MKGYAVFNVEQIDGVPAHYYAKAAEPREPVARIEHAKAFFAATGATIKHDGKRAFYAPSRDFVQMPPREALRTRRTIAPPWRTSSPTGRPTLRAVRAN
jgi:antirestriction protein ArdC